MKKLVILLSVLFVSMLTLFMGGNNKNKKITFLELLMRRWWDQEVKRYSLELMEAAIFLKMVKRYMWVIKVKSMLKTCHLQSSHG